MDFLTKLQIPLCQKTRIPVKTLIEQIGGDSRSKKIIEKHIASINLVSLLDEQTIKIRAYKDDNYSFHVIYVLVIDLKTNEQMTEFTELVHSAFPESTLLILEYKENTYISGAYKRINKNNKSRTVIEDCVWAETFEGLNFNPPSAENLKEYYAYMLRWLYRIKAENVTGVFPQNDIDCKPLIKEYEDLASSINKLKEDYNNASMIREKIQIDDKIYSRENEMQNLINRMRGEK